MWTSGGASLKRLFRRYAKAPRRRRVYVAVPAVTSPRRHNNTQSTEREQRAARPLAAALANFPNTLQRRARARLPHVHACPSSTDVRYAGLPFPLLFYFDVWFCTRPSEHLLSATCSALRKRKASRFINQHTCFITVEPNGQNG